MHGGGHLAQTQGCALGLCQKAPIAIKIFGFIERRIIEEASYEDLERVVIDNNPKRFFQVGV